MKNSMQLKAFVKNLAKSKNISAQIVMQNYMLERFLERVSLSLYQSNFILKGGFLIAAIVGLDTRATMDMDATLQGLPVNVETIARMFDEICQIPVSDDVIFSVKQIQDIRKEDEYSGLRVSLEAKYPPMTVPLKIDVTTGDKITPKEIVYHYKLLFEPRTIRVLAYNLETILAEKLETIISRGDQNTRLRDYYDMMIIKRLQWQNVNIGSLRKALTATAKKRDTLHIMVRYIEILEMIEKSDVMKNHWSNYQKQFKYAKDIRFEDICQTIKEICGLLL